MYRRHGENPGHMKFSEPVQCARMNLCPPQEGWERRRSHRVCTIPPVWVPHSPSVRAGPIRDRLFFRRITRVQKSWEKVARPGLLIKQLRIWVVVASGPFLVSPPQYPPWACTHVTQGSNLAFSSDFCLPRAEGPDHLNDGLHPALLPLFSLPPFL